MTEQDLQKCFDIIDKLEEIGEPVLLARLACNLVANSKTARDVCIGQWGEIVELGYE